MIYTKTKQKGFTLIELLVVISIIGVITTLITSNLAQAQSRARDARRKTDLRVIAQGLEQYYIQNNSYPVNGTNAGEFAFASANLTDATTSDIYIKSIPKDPKNVTADSYEYFYCTRATSTATGSKPKQYNLYAKLENANDPEKYCTTSSWSNGTCEFTTSPVMSPAPVCGTGSNGGSKTLSQIQTGANYVIVDP